MFQEGEENKSQSQGHILYLRAKAQGKTGRYPDRVDNRELVGQR